MTEIRLMTKEERDIIEQRVNDKITSAKQFFHDMRIGDLLCYRIATEEILNERGY